MLPCKSFLVLLLVTYATAASLESSSLTRSERSADANVVEYTFGGKLRGRCSYIDRTKKGISLVYEEENGVIKARSLNAVIDDPAAAVRECRSAADKGSQDEHKAEGNSGLLAPQTELKDGSRGNRKGRQFIYGRDPRFITWLGSLFGGGTNIGSSANNNFGLSWGNTGNSYNPFPGVNLFAPGNSGNNRLTTTYGNANPFDFLSQGNMNSGPWGVLNSISSNQNGLFGLGSVFGGGLFSPFGAIG